MSIKNIDQYNSLVYKQLSAWIEKNYMERGVIQQGQDVKTLQRSLSLRLLKRKPLSQQLGIMDFLPYLEYDYLYIFEFTLSAGGIYKLENINNNPTLTITRFSVKKEIKKFETLLEALKYIHQNHYYE